MSTVIAFTQAKSRLSEILDRVSLGEEFVITRHDEMIARLVPVHGPTNEEVRQAIGQLKELRKGTRISLEEVTLWKNEGRR
jgi:prevent-host-death family protein